MKAYVEGAGKEDGGSRTPTQTVEPSHGHCPVHAQFISTLC